MEDLDREVLKIIKHLGYPANPQNIRNVLIKRHRKPVSLAEVEGVVNKLKDEGFIVIADTFSYVAVKNN